MFTNKRHLVIVLAVLAALTAACNRDAGPKGGRPRIALVLKTLNNPFFIDMQRGAQEAAERLGVDLVVQAAEREIDVEKQMQIVENLIQTARRGAGAHAERLARNRARRGRRRMRAKMPVVIVDTRLDAQRRGRRRRDRPPPSSDRTTTRADS